MRLQDRLCLHRCDLTSIVQRIEAVCKCSFTIEAAESLAIFDRLTVFVDFWVLTEWAVHFFYTYINTFYNPSHISLIHDQRNPMNSNARFANEILQDSTVNLTLTKQHVQYDLLDRCRFQDELKLLSQSDLTSNRV